MLINQILKKLYRGILRKLPDKAANYLIYFRGYKKILNLKNPMHFGEKIQWLKLYGHLEELSCYVDKYEVRKYVESKIGKGYLNTLYGVFDTVEDIDFSILPNKFVIKCTNGSGALLICRDKTKFDYKKAIRQMKGWLKKDFSKEKKEYQYRNIKNRIIIEQYLEDESGALRDYKFYCYDGKPYYYGIFNNRYTDKTIDMYDMTGKKLEGVFNGGIKNSNITIPQSDSFQDLIEVVMKLAEPFQFVRVDFYIVNDKLYFGELTFTDGAGADAFFPESFDIEMASRIKLGRVFLETNE